MPPDLESRVRVLLHQLRMRDADEHLSTVLPDGPAQRRYVLQALHDLLAHEDARRTERRIERRKDAARFPDTPTLETFDFAFQTGIDRGLVMDLATMNWVDRSEDLVLVGQSGVGKSHIAKALGLIACSQQRRVLYTSCAGMLDNLYASLADGTLAQALKAYTRPTLLVVDDLGYDPIEQEKAREAQLLYKVLDARHGAVSTIITSNLPPNAWGDYLGDHYLTVALLDRLLYRGTVISIEGPSWRMAEHQRRKESRKGLQSKSDPEPE